MSHYSAVWITPFTKSTSLAIQHTLPVCQIGSFWFTWAKLKGLSEFVKFTALLGFFITAGRKKGAQHKIAGHATSDLYRGWIGQHTAASQSPYPFSGAGACRCRPALPFLTRQTKGTVAVSQTADCWQVHVSWDTGHIWTIELTGPCKM